MKLAIVVNATPKATPLAADISLEDAVRLAKDAGFDGVELAIADPLDLDAVSYTHLDVYKRQIISSSLSFT